MHAHWQKGYYSNTDIVANETPAYLKRFIGSFVNSGLKYSSDPYRMVMKVPDELTTMFDPYEVGDRPTEVAVSFEAPLMFESRDDTQERLSIKLTEERFAIRWGTFALLATLEATAR